MRYVVTLKSKDGTEKAYYTCLSFVFEKEIFTPYTSLTAILCGTELPEDVVEIKFSLEGKDIHHGFVDSYRLTKRNGMFQGVITSRGFTALLTENQLPPGMYSNMTFNKLFDEYIAFPNVEHEDNSQSSYIYVKKGASIWDSVANLSYKISGTYPYIYERNMVRMNTPPTPKEFKQNISMTISYGTEFNTRRMVSKFNMADITGEYGTYSAESSIAAERNIIRQRHFELDERFLNNPDLACQFRMMMAERDYKQYFFNYSGYDCHDINDVLISDEFGKRRINAVRIAGDKNGIRTKLVMYDSIPPIE